jgi:hypothetical protein
MLNLQGYIKREEQYQFESYTRIFFLCYSSKINILREIDKKNGGD